MTEAERLYSVRDHQAQGDYYLRHVSAMTGEGLHAKSAIAGELAHRDMVIDAQAAEIEALQHKLRVAEETLERCKAVSDAMADWLRADAAELEALRADAERLDSRCIALTENDEFGDEFKRIIVGIDLRAAIDAARKK